MSDPIILIGPMGAGKSTIGRLLAAKMGREFVDSDHEIEARTGADIPWIFDVEGEAGFRDREHAVLKDLLCRSGVILATGGGIVVRDENRTLLEKQGQVIYLLAGIDQLVERTYKDKKRPLLQVDDPKKKIVELFNLRDPLYRSVASYTVKTDGMVPKQVVSKIMDLLDSAV